MLLQPCFEMCSYSKLWLLQAFNWKIVMLSPKRWDVHFPKICLESTEISMLNVTFKRRPKIEGTRFFFFFCFFFTFWLKIRQNKQNSKGKYAHFNIFPQFFLFPGKCIKTPLFTPREVHKNTSFYSPGTARKLGSSENSVHKGAGYIGWLVKNF